MEPPLIPISGRRRGMRHKAGLWTSAIAALGFVFITAHAAAQPGPEAPSAKPVQEVPSQSPIQPSTDIDPPAPPPGTAAAPVEDPMGSMEKRVSILEEWKTKIEKLPALSNKVNFGLNA